MTEPEPLDYYSVPLWMMRGYLNELGGVEVEADTFAGDGWRAVLSAAPWRPIGSLRIGGTRAVVTGDPAALERFFARLHQKTMRGGG